MTVANPGISKRGGGGGGGAAPGGGNSLAWGLFCCPFTHTLYVFVARVVNKIKNVTLLID